jgi:hypothetical protein
MNDGSSPRLAAASRLSSSQLSQTAIYVLYLSTLPVNLRDLLNPPESGKLYAWNDAASGAMKEAVWPWKTRCKATTLVFGLIILVLPVCCPVKLAAGLCGIGVPLSLSWSYSY